jgi:hypothetical protein
MNYSVKACDNSILILSILCWSFSFSDVYMTFQYLIVCLVLDFGGEVVLLES